MEAADALVKKLALNYFQIVILLKNDNVTPKIFQPTDVDSRTTWNFSHDIGSIMRTFRG